MDFFKKFKELYNHSKSFENVMFINSESWLNFQNKIKDYNYEKYEILYRVIVHYHYVETHKLEDFPYKLKIYSTSETENGIVFEPKNLPLCLQYILLNW
jgi:hypothetical protein